MNLMILKIICLHSCYNTIKVGVFMLFSGCVYSDTSANEDNSFRNQIC